MRRGDHPGIIRLDDGKFLGICLGSDACAEHEWGIGELRESFGMDKSLLGIEARRSTTHDPKMLQAFPCKAGKDVLALIYGRRELNTLPYDLEDGRLENGLAAAWDEGSFGIIADPTLGGNLKELEDAIRRNDIVLAFGGGGAFENPGLNVLVASRVPKDMADKWKKGDEDKARLREAAKATGIEERLQKAGKKWFALSPAWAKNHKAQTKHPVVFWLNPREQHIHNFGWFTVEELEPWTRDKGIVMKKERKP